ncbi:MAG: double zinc ribbon domain-containing protein, partial [Candidatus Brocadiia bacterium]
MNEAPAGLPLHSAAGHAVEAVLDWFYPRHCYHCGRPLHEPRAHILCRECFRALRERRIGSPQCGVCGLPLTGEFVLEKRCLHCLSRERYFERARAMFPYGGPMESILRSYKFHGDYFLGPRLLRGTLRRGWLPPDLTQPDAVLPVPLHPRRRRERGYDQSLLLAATLSDHLGAPLLEGSLIRTRYTRQQARLSMRRREDNVRGAFDVERPGKVEGRRLLVV